jgi:hypothetical protein
MFFTNYWDVASKQPAGTTLIFSRGVPVKSIKGNTGDFDLLKGMFAYNSNNSNNSDNFNDNLA